MKIKNIIAVGAIALASLSAANAATVVNLTGATAFRAAANASIIAVLGGAGGCQYAYTGTQGISGTNRAIFKGNLLGDVNKPYVVRVSWSGSTQGILDLADQTPIQYLTEANPTSTGGTNLGESGNPAPLYENAVARWSFSDVDKLLSSRPNATLGGGPVGVVPFMFLAGEGAPAGITNMTDQIHEVLWSTGQINASFFGSASTSTTVLATGRNNGSGTRASILAETAYGAFTPVVQFNATYTGNRTDSYPTAALGAVTQFSTNSGHSSNSGVRELLTRPRQDMTFDGSPVDAVFVSYLTISDALSAITEGAIEMTYNGVNYTADNVKNGAYSLWGYQQLYLAGDATAGETEFDTALRGAVPANMGTAGIPIPDMTVTRTGGDGGPIFPN